MRSKAVRAPSGPPFGWGGCARWIIAALPSIMTEWGIGHRGIPQVSSRPGGFENCGRKTTMRQVYDSFASRMLLAFLAIGSMTRAQSGATSTRDAVEARLEEAFAKQVTRLDVDWRWLSDNRWQLGIDQKLIGCLSISLGLPHDLREFRLGLMQGCDTWN